MSNSLVIGDPFKTLKICTSGKQTHASKLCTYWFTFPASFKIQTEAFLEQQAS